MITLFQFCKNIRGVVCTFIFLPQRAQGKATTNTKAHLNFENLVIPVYSLCTPWLLFDSLGAIYLLCVSVDRQLP
ncbi:MAG: hypothetical protein BGN92_04155 [Sphingobacteriales bacterium 41-5]|nr:MAG: hypothetical protein BGN92_04155 [Sphingobacteriales bacterium 41-5]